MDKSISHFEATIFEKYFGKEIEDAIKSNISSGETEKRLLHIQMLIQGGETSASDIFASRLPIQFKRKIYPQLFEKYRQNLLQEIRERRKLKEDVDASQLPATYKQTWFSRFKNYIKNRFINKKEEHSRQTESSSTNSKSFKQYVSNMSNYSKNTEEKMDISEQHHHKTIHNYDETEKYK